MKILAIVFCIAALAAGGIAAACSLEKGSETMVGNNIAVTGECSNNGLRVTCYYREGFGISCDGPAGGYSGYDLGSLVYSACGCNAQEEDERRWKEEIEKLQ